MILNLLVIISLLLISACNENGDLLIGSNCIGGCDDSSDATRAFYYMCKDSEACNYLEEFQYSYSGQLSFSLYVEGACRYCYEDDCNKYPPSYYNCNGGCNIDVDNDSICDDVDPCTDGIADNYTLAIEDDFSSNDMVITIREAEGNPPTTILSEITPWGNSIEYNICLQKSIYYILNIDDNFSYNDWDLNIRDTDGNIVLSYSDRSDFNTTFILD